MIFVTPNEKRSTIPNLLSIFEISYKERELKVGDYFCGEITPEGSYLGVPVERKAIGDYLSSLNNGHRDTQLYELSYNFPLSFWVNIGSPSLALMGADMSMNAFISSLVGISLKTSPDGVGGRVILVNLETDDQFVRFLKYLDEKIKDGDVTRVPKMQKRTWSPEEHLEYIISSLPGVGTKTAEKLLNHFGTVRRVMSASQDELEEVEGIGHSKALEIFTVINMQFKPSPVVEA